MYVHTYTLLSTTYPTPLVQPSAPSFSEVRGQRSELFLNGRRRRQKKADFAGEREPDRPDPGAKERLKKTTREKLKSE